MKLTKHAWILWGIALATVLTLSFVLPFAKTAEYLMALLCTLAMFTLCAFAFVRAFRQKNTLESKLLGWPIFQVAVVALAVQVVVGFALMAVGPLTPVWAALLVEAAVFAVTGFSLTVKDAAREAVTQAETKMEDRTQGWKAIRARASALAAGSDNAQLRRLAEEIRYADPMPTSVDGEIMEALSALEADPGAAHCSRLADLLAKRRAIAKQQKSA